MSARRVALAFVVAGAAVGSAGTAVAQDAPPPKETALLSRTPAGGFPNGPSFGAAISGDRQLASLTAFTSAASDLVPGDTNGDADAFVRDLVPQRREFVAVREHRGALGRQGGKNGRVLACDGLDRGLDDRHVHLQLA